MRLGGLLQLEMGSFAKDRFDSIPLYSMSISTDVRWITLGLRHVYQAATCSHCDTS